MLDNLIDNFGTGIALSSSFLENLKGVSLAVSTSE